MVTKHIKISLKSYFPTFPQNQTNLRATVEAHDTVELWDGRRVDSRCVSPGDIVVLPARGCTLHFDAALLSGAAVVNESNESMLTGEYCLLQVFSLAPRNGGAMGWEIRGLALRVARRHRGVAGAGLYAALWCCVTVGGCGC